MLFRFIVNLSVTTAPLPRKVRAAHFFENISFKQHVPNFILFISMATPLSFRAPYTLAVHRGKVLCASAELGVKIISVYPVNCPKMVLFCPLLGQTVSADKIQFPLRFLHTPFSVVPVHHYR